jgi:anaerobic magnesium-protoporphyrin IX monomethyl ester cyclase
MGYSVKPQVLLIAPDAPFLYDAHALPPLGLLYLGAALESAGYQPIVADLSDFEARFGGPDPVLIGMTATTAQYPQLPGLIRLIRAAYPGVPVMLGGPHFSVVPGDGAALGADAVGTGDCEEAIIRAAADAQRGVLQPIYNSPGNVVDVNRWPIPARHLVPIHEYRYFLNGEAATPIVTQRGCPFACGFCVHWQGYRRARPRDLSNVKSEIQMLKRDGFRAFMIYDDEFNVNNKRLLAFCELIEPERIQFRVMLRSDLFTSEQAAALKRAGCHQIGVGVESGSEKILRAITKGTTPAVNSRCRAICREHGIAFKAFVIVGLPGETRETVEESRRWLVENEVDDFNLQVFMGYPGAPIYDHPERYDIQINSDYRTTVLSFRGSAEVPLARASRTAALSADELVTLRDQIEHEVRGSLGLPAPLSRRNDETNIQHYPRLGSAGQLACQS